MPSTKKTLEYLYGLDRLGVKKGLSRITALVERLGSPHLMFPSVHVAGTNGKGSVCAVISSILTEAGYSTGLYTSPHLIRFNERIRVGGSAIPDKELARTALEIKNAIERSGLSAKHPTFFEFTTALAFLHFAKKKVDIAVIEAGMGGRWDATNVTAPLVSIITNVELDHTDVLGKTVSDIAYEKAGIIKKGAPVITAETKPAALAPIIRAARRNGSPVYRLGRAFNVKTANSRPAAFDYLGMSSGIKGLETALPGAHQIRNAACALAAVETLRTKGWDIPDSAMRRGVKNVRWPARVEVVGKRPLVIVDAAHNPAGASVLRLALKEFSYDRLILVLGILADKDIDGILRELAPAAHTVILTAPKNSRAASPGELLQRLKTRPERLFLIGSVEDACSTALREAGTRDAVCVAGSVYTAGEALTYLKRVLS